MNTIKKLFDKLTFSSAILLAPLAYAIHHMEEKEGSFRIWRARYFAQNNPLTTEYVFIILTFITILSFLLFSIRKSKPTANGIIFFLMMSQLTNAFFHVGAGIYFMDYSPGTVTAIVLYLPVNFLILYKARMENWISKKTMILLIALGALSFAIFELFGGIAIPVLSLITLTYILLHEIRISKN